MSLGETKIKKKQEAESKKKIGKYKRKKFRNVIREKKYKINLKHYQ